MRKKADTLRFFLVKVSASLHIITQTQLLFFLFTCLRLRKFTFGNNGVESTHDALIKYQAMTFGFNITLFCIRSKPSFSSGQTPAYSSWLCF